MKRTTLLLVVLALFTLAGCAPELSGGGPATVAARQNPNLLRADDIGGFASALDAVQGKRAQWLRVRNAATVTTTGQQVQVYLDNMRLGGPRELDRMTTMDIASMQYFDGHLASQRWGLGHENGVILVNTHNQ